MKKIVKKLKSGQSLVEVAIIFPVLLILLSGLLEFGFMLNEYMTIQDAVRNAARFASDGDFMQSDTPYNQYLCADPETGFPQESCCKGKNSITGEVYGIGTLDFFRQTACLVNDELNQMSPDIEMHCLAPGSNDLCYWGVLDPNNGLPENKDEILISAYSVNKLPNGTSQVTQFPGLNGWSYAENYIGYSGVRNQNSRFSIAEISARLDNSAPNSGYILVEVFYNYDQKLKLPWITAFVPDPILLHVYAIMPLSSAEPTPTPISYP